MRGIIDASLCETSAIMRRCAQVAFRPACMVSVH
jgi:hypothetical protein